MKAINLDTYSLSLLTAKEDILNPRSSTNWALFTYDGATNNLKLSDSGAGGMSELAGKFEASRPLYGLCRVQTQGSVPRVLMITWMGDEVDEYRRAECLDHIPAIKAFFKEAHVFVNANTPDDVTEEKICEIASKISTQSERQRKSSQATENEETVGTNYRRTNAAMEMRRINRESFWARAEREEEERKEEERRRAAEDRRRWERERVLKERKEAEERDRKMEEKLQMIEEQRRMQAKAEAEVRKQERARWELQQQEHEEDMRSRFKRSESIEKAAEAAALVSQRSINPREFFRQLSSTSSSPGVPPSPGSPRTGKPPFRRYQRSLTDTAFIFGKSDSSVPSSPRSPALVSPFGRIPNSPFNRAMSPTSPTHPVVSSPSLQAPLASPPWSPQRLAPTATLPSLPAVTSTSPPSTPSQSANAARPSDPPSVSPRSAGLPSSLSLSSSSTQNSAPPASPGLSTSVTHPEPVPHSSSDFLDSTTIKEDLTVPVSVSPVPPTQQSEDTYTACRMLTDFDSDSDLPVKAVLVDTHITSLVEDEDGESDEGEEHEQVELQLSAQPNIPTESPPSENEEDTRAVSPPALTVDSDLGSVQVYLDAEEQACPVPAAVSSVPDITAISMEFRPGLEDLAPAIDSTDRVVAEIDADPAEDAVSGQPQQAVAEWEEDEEETGCLASGARSPALSDELVLDEHTDPEEERVDTDALPQDLGAADMVTGGEDAHQTVPQPAKRAHVDGRGHRENGLTGGYNGTEWSFSCHEMEKNFCDLQGLELTSCAMRHDGIEEDFVDEADNETMSSSDGQLCVRALYDYEAEDESELSLEPGDIISAVETVDKAWWRGCNKDGRQGLFPANYVETI